MSASIGADARPRLAPGVRLRHDRLTGNFLLLRPEKGFELRGSALDIVRLCDGASTVDSIIDQLAQNHRDAPRPEIATDVTRLLDELLARHLIAVEGESERNAP